MSRPKIKLVPTPLEKIAEGMTTGVLLIHLIVIAIVYSSLPPTIPTHYGLDLKADGFGPKATILMLPTIHLIITCLLFWLNRKPHIFNYPVEVTDENAEKLYKSATQMLRILNLTVSVIFLSISLKTALYH